MATRFDRPAQPQQTTNQRPKTSSPAASSAIATVNNFELAGKMKAIDQKAALLEVARTAYREEMATLPEEIAEMLAEEDMGLDVADFFGIGQLTSEDAPQLDGDAIEVLTIAANSGV
jgi:hypothetical protein